MKQSTTGGLLEKLHLAQLPVRLSLLAKTLPRWLKLGRQFWEVRGWLRFYDRQLAEIEATWQRWDTVRPGRERQQIRRRLQQLERPLRERQASVMELADELHASVRSYWTLTRWLLQGHVDDRDGPSKRILKPDDSE